MGDRRTADELGLNRQGKATCHFCAAQVSVGLDAWRCSGEAWRGLKSEHAPGCEWVRGVERHRGQVP